MKLQIPHCKQLMTLTEDCTVDIPITHYVGGNLKLLTAKGFLRVEKKTNYRDKFFDLESGNEIGYFNEGGSYPVTFPKGTILMITKLYIRNGGWFDDCVNFKIVSSPDKALDKRIGAITIGLEDTQQFNVMLHDKNGDLK